MGFLLLFVISLLHFKKDEWGREVRIEKKNSFCFLKKGNSF